MIYSDRSRKSTYHLAAIRPSTHLPTERSAYGTMYRFWHKADQRHEFAVAGGFVGYGTDIADTHRFVGIYAGRVLKGEKPADLPVQQATKVELYINLKTAKALGITVPSPILGRADQIIE